MNDIILKLVDTLITKTLLLSKAVDGVVRLIFPNTSALAGCGSTYYCATTDTGEFCMDGCYYWQGQCRILKQPRVNVWTSDVSNCYNPCITWTGCAAIQVGNICSSPCPA